MNTKVCIITGGNSGIGYEVVKKLLVQNYTVIIGCRDSPKTKSVLASLESNYKENTSKLIHIPLDLSDFASVREFVEKFNELGLHLNLLINNAGAFYNNEGLKNNEGIDMVLATNYYGHFLLTYLLMDKLKSTEGSRVVSVSSSLFKGANFDLPVTELNPVDDRDAPRHSKGVYPFSKWLTILSTQKYSKLYTNPTFTTVCPGFIPTTDLGRDNNLVIKFLMNWVFPWFSFTSTLDEGVNRVLEASFRGLNELPAKDGDGVWHHVKEEWERLNYDEAKVDELWDHTLKVLKLE